MESTPEPLICRYRWTEEEAWKAARYHGKKTFRWPFRVLGVLLLLLFMVALGWSLYTEGLTWLSAFLLFLLIYGLFFRKLESRWWHRRRFRRRPDRDALLELHLSEDGISSKVEGLGEGRGTWAAVFKALRTPEGVLVYHNERIFYWLPFHGFTSGDAAAELDRLLRAKVSRYESL